MRGPMRQPTKAALYAEIERLRAVKTRRTQPWWVGSLYIVLGVVVTLVAL